MIDVTLIVPRHTPIGDVEIEEVPAKVPQVPAVGNRVTQDGASHIVKSIEYKLTQRTELGANPEVVERFQKVYQVKVYL